MEDNSKSSIDNLTTGLFLLFLGLKLAGIGQVADWSWWWVFSPIWIVFLVIILVNVLKD